MASYLELRSGADPRLAPIRVDLPAEVVNQLATGEITVWVARLIAAVVHHDPPNTVAFLQALRADRRNNSGGLIAFVIDEPGYPALEAVRALGEPLPSDAQHLAP